MNRSAFKLGAWKFKQIFKWDGWDVCMFSNHALCLMTVTVVMISVLDAIMGFSIQQGTVVDNALYHSIFFQLHRNTYEVKQQQTLYSLLGCLGLSYYFFAKRKHRKVKGSSPPTKPSNTQTPGVRTGLIEPTGTRLRFTSPAHLRSRVGIFSLPCLHFVTPKYTVQSCLNFYHMYRQSNKT